MSWVQENKFTATLAGVSVVGAGVLLGLTMSKNSDFEATNKRLKRALAQERALRSAVIYPQEENLEELKLDVDGLAKTARKLQIDFEAYRPTSNELADFSADRFGSMVKAYKERLDAAFAKNNINLPDNCIYGFEVYKSKSPIPTATGELQYQMQALEWLLKKLAELSPDALLNVSRARLDIESGMSNDDANAAYVVMPLELSFRSDEESVKDFLEAIANSKKYAFTVRQIRFQNEKLVPPSSKDASFQQSPEAVPVEDIVAADTIEFPIVGESEELAEESIGRLNKPLAQIASDNDDTKLLSQILGDEKVNVYLKLDLIVLKEGKSASLEEMKQEAGVAAE